jgi:arylformamidase
MFVRLSYDITADSPGWPGNPTVEHSYYSDASRGDPATHSILTIFSHFGSHVDAPSHVNPLGPGICDLDLSYYIFENPLLLDVPKGEREIVSQADLASVDACIQGHDLLLVRTGWSRVRGEDAGRYARYGPAMSSEAASYIINGFPELKGIGIDCISLGSPESIREAIAVHDILAGKGGTGRGLVNIEDIHLRIDAQNLRRVYALPLFMEGLEGSPCTVVAEMSETGVPNQRKDHHG